MAGNAVILKHSAQTPLVRRALPAGVRCRRPARGPVPASGADPRRHRQGDRRAGRRLLSTSPARSPAAMRCSRRRSASSSALGLELGGKDPAYVRADANLDHAVENLVDGAFFNSGQCCCAHRAHLCARRAVYDKFVDGFVDLTNKYKLGNPLDASDQPRAHGAHLGRRVRARPDRRRACKHGAKALIDPKSFAADKRRHAVPGAAGAGRMSTTPCA